MKRYSNRIALELYLKEWDFDDFSKIKNNVIKCFEKWLKENPLEITAGRKEKTTELTFGFPYTSSGICAELGNTNCQAELVLFRGTKDERRYFFRCLRLVELKNSETEKHCVCAFFEDREGNEKILKIGRF